MATRAELEAELADQNGAYIILLSPNVSQGFYIAGSGHLQERRVGLPDFIQGACMFSGVALSNSSDARQFALPDDPGSSQFAGSGHNIAV